MQWVCGTCTLQDNSNVLTACRLCGTPRAPVSAPAAMQTNSEPLIVVGTVVGADPIADGVVALGFGYPEAVQAAAATGNKSVEAAVQWLLQQEEAERQIADQGQQVNQVEAAASSRWLQVGVLADKIMQVHITDPKMLQLATVTALPFSSVFCRYYSRMNQSSKWLLQ